MNSSPLFLPSLAFILGVGAGSFGLVPWWVMLAVLAAGIIAFGLFQTKRVAALVVAFSFLMIGCFLAEREIGRVNDAAAVPDRMSGAAEVAGIPKRKLFFQEIVVRFAACREGDCPRDLALVQVPLSDRYTYGDHIDLTCAALSIPKNFSPDFDYRMYLAKDGILYQCEKPAIRRTGESPWSAGLFGFSRRFEDSVSARIPEPESALAMGILLGGDDRFPDETTQWFRGAGLSHVVAVSGYNITILSFAFLLIGILCFLSRRQAILFALAASGLFVFLAGMPSSGVRALAMAAVVFLATLLGRRSQSVPALAFAGAVMLLENPLLLRYDVGFDLSFLATLGIVLFTPLSREILSRVRHGQFLLETALLTISAELLILPVLFSTFKTFSLVAIFSNALLLPLTPGAMLCSFLAGLFGMISPVLGELFAFPAYVLLHVFIEGAKWFSEIGVGRITLDHFGWLDGMMWYTAVFAMLFSANRKIKGNR